MPLFSIRYNKKNKPILSKNPAMYYELGLQIAVAADILVNAQRKGEENVIFDGENDLCFEDNITNYED